MVQTFCGQMPFLFPTSRNHSLDRILSPSTKTQTKQEKHQSLYVGCLTPEDTRSKTWWNCIKYDMESLGLTQKDAQFRNKWRIKAATG